MKWTGLLSLVGAAAFTVACGNGRDGAVADRADDTAAVGTSGDARIDQPGAPADTRASVNDTQEFVNQAAMAGNAEVALGKLASEHAVNREVKQFAQMMVRDHTKGNEELKQAVSPHNLDVPATLDSKHQELMDKLRGTAGAEFDREYMAAMVEGHEEVKALVEGRTRRGDSRNANNTAATGASADHNQQAEIAVNQWAAKRLPGVEEHLQRAKEINQRLEEVRSTSRN
jgi:putative membrane protein